MGRWTVRRLWRQRREAGESRGRCRSRWRVVVEVTLVAFGYLRVNENSLQSDG